MRRPLCQPLGKRYNRRILRDSPAQTIVSSSPFYMKGKLRLSQLEQLASMMLRESGRLGFVPQGCLTPHSSLSSMPVGPFQVPGWGDRVEKKNLPQGKKKLQVPDSRNAQSYELCRGPAFPSL